MARLAIAILLCGISGALAATTVPGTWIWNSSPVVDYFIGLIQGKSIGALHCKTDRCCGDGLKCDMMLHLCVPLTTPVFRDTEKSCTGDNECSALFTCYMGSCRFSGPSSCRSTGDCFLGGNTNVTMECLDIKYAEKWSIAKDLGRINTKMFEHMKPHKLDDQYDVDYEDLESMGFTSFGDHVMHGKRCWERCSIDVDCALDRVPETMWKGNWGCCNGYCTRKLSCINVPEKLRGIEKFENRMAKTTF